eukprot:jgi/Chlat1/5636/Chrsp369S05386
MGTAGAAAAAGKEGAAGGQRRDGRTASQLRPMDCRRGLLSRADGSARWSQGKTTVLAAVYGPRGLPAKRENAETAVLEVLVKPQTGTGGPADRELEQFIRGTLTHIVLLSLHPRTGISVVLQVVNDDGSVLVCAINAACAALVDAGVPLKGILAAASCFYDSQGALSLDPDQKESQSARAELCLTFRCEPPQASGHSNKETSSLVSSDTRGHLTEAEFLASLAAGHAASKSVASFLTTSFDSQKQPPDVTAGT